MARDQVTVAVDANGADLGPAEVAAGAALAAQEGVHIRLFGPRAELGGEREGVELVDAPVSIAKHADPARAVRQTQDASIVRAARTVADGGADALVAGGSTGAALAAGLLHVRRSPGVYRPALALHIPLPRTPVLLLDVGANSEARTDHLVQFAFMGAAFARGVLGVAKPRVGLLSNGEEATRGTELVVGAHRELEGASSFEFVGNVEGTGLTGGAADVVVTDGFTGNVALKVMEGMAASVLGGVRAAAMSTTRAKVGGMLLRPAVSGLRDQLDPERTGGAYLLGLRRLGVVYHGRFSRRGIASAIAVAARGVREDVVERTTRELAEAGALRGEGEREATGDAASEQ